LAASCSQLEAAEDLSDPLAGTTAALGHLAARYQALHAEISWPGWSNKPGPTCSHSKEQAPASSGKTQRHRLNRGGDRQANRALYLIALSRTIHDPPAPAPTSNAAPNAKSCAASSATSPASSTTF
jgi:hypothetical protein